MEVQPVESVKVEQNNEFRAEKRMRSCADMLKPRIITNQPMRVEGQQNNAAETTKIDLRTCQVQPVAD